MHGFVLWFTGLSGSGKSTLATLVAGELRRRGVHVETLDGDEIRRHLSKGLGFSRDDRDENIRRIGFVAKLVARSGSCAIAAAISPYREVRNEVRRSCERFVEVYTECPVSVLAERDPKGLYKRALAGEIRNFTGVDDPYEAPDAPDVHLYTDRERPEDSLAKIVGRLEVLGLIPRWGQLLGGDAPNERPRLAAPHGLELVDGIVPEQERTQAQDIAAALPEVQLGVRSLAELAAVASGAYSPLDGFMTSKDVTRVAKELRLESGLPWASTVVLPIPVARAVEVRRVGELALSTPSGKRIATMHVEDVFQSDRAVAGLPKDDSVAYVGGKIRCFDPAAAGITETPEAVRARLDELGARRVAYVETRLPPLAREEHVVRAALELADAVLLRPTEGDGVFDRTSRTLAWEALLARYFPPRRAFVLPAASAPAAEARRSAIHSAIVAKNHGATRLVLLDERDEAAWVSWLDCYLPGELGIEVDVAGRGALSREVRVATSQTAPAGSEALDTDSLSRDIARGKPLDERLVRADIAAILCPSR